MLKIFIVVSEENIHTTVIYHLIDMVVLLLNIHVFAHKRLALRLQLLQQLVYVVLLSLLVLRLKLLAARRHHHSDFEVSALLRHAVDHRVMLAFLLAGRLHDRG